MKTSKPQRQFYRELLIWIKAGTPHTHPVFVDSRGICSNYKIWCEYYNKRDNLLKASFKAAGLDTWYPFNNSCEDYHYECQHHLIYTNPARLEWIRKHA